MIVPATAELLREYYGHDPLFTSRAIVYLEEGKPVAIAGFIRMGSKTMIAYSESKPGFTQRNKRGVVLMVRAMMKIADDNGWTLVAQPNAELDTAEGFLQHIGFVRSDDGRFIR